MYVVNGFVFFFFFQAEDGIRDDLVTGVQTCALPILNPSPGCLRKQKCPLHSLHYEGQTKAWEEKSGDVLVKMVVSKFRFGNDSELESTALFLSLFVDLETGRAVDG